jgi:hypothetical protein
MIARAAGESNRGQPRFRRPSSIKLRTLLSAADRPVLRQDANTIPVIAARAARRGLAEAGGRKPKLAGRGSVMSFCVYEPGTVRALSQAVAAGMGQIERTAANALLLSGRPASTKALISSLLAAANSGENDPEKFRAIALKWAAEHFDPAAQAQCRLSRDDVATHRGQGDGVDTDARPTSRIRDGAVA